MLRSIHITPPVCSLKEPAFLHHRAAVYRPVMAVQQYLVPLVVETVADDSFSVLNGRKLCGSTPLTAILSTFIPTLLTASCSLPYSQLFEPTVMPVNETGGGSASQLDRVGIGNVAKKNHLYAHAVMAWVFFGFIRFLIARE
ncbi:hypothetical protein K432DRAFT_395580 [Lepidopterella palustris CBS 459.81]|uniref:CSC1/OSCA1-like N-terminal transmembrane domain-containing protein n=1 Tax=Lepidopterella palustris CBS 459.81 TaxID=1314670 RepID=A0A8E2E549_9PEZI|nr:hypothetical protein K432DRAFT_395580 [Lepidopterella palustris CBS 459.81]